jgi:hypothetical protein
LTALDRADGGFSLLIRSPGSLPPKVDGVERELNFRDVVMDAYLPPREVMDHRDELEEPVARVAQIFGHQIGLPYLRRLQTRLQVSHADVTRVELEPDIINTRNLIPSPKTGTSTYKFFCHDPQTFAQLLSPLQFNVDASADANTDNEFGYGDDPFDIEEVSRIMDAIPDSAVTTSYQPKSVPPTPYKRQVTKRPQHDGSNKIATVEKITASGRPFTSPVEAIVSIGPATDSVIDKLSLTDDWIVSLHHLVKNNRNTRWMPVLMDWGVPELQAQAIVDALVDDIIPASAPKV